MRFMVAIWTNGTRGVLPHALAAHVDGRQVADRLHARQQLHAFVVLRLASLWLVELGEDVAGGGPWRW